VDDGGHDLSRFFAFRTTRAATVLTELLGTAYGGVVNCRSGQDVLLTLAAAVVLGSFETRLSGLDRLGRWDEKASGTRLDEAHAKDVPVVGPLSRRDADPDRLPASHETDPQGNRGLTACAASFAGIGMADELWRHRERLWTFVRRGRSRADEQRSERALRHAVIWRKLSFGTQSEAGSRFVETMLTVVETCRQQSRNALAFVTTAVEAHLHNQPTPSLARCERYHPWSHGNLEPSP